MIRRRTVLSSALAASAALGVAACSKKGSSGSSSSASDGGGAIDAVSVGGEVGAEPTVSFDAPLTISATQSKVITEAHGEAIAEGDTLALHTLYVDASTGKTLQSSWQGAPANYLSANADSNGDEVVAFLTGTTVGSRVLMLGNLQNQSGKTVSVVQVSDILGKALKRAEGTSQPVPDGMPTFTLKDNGAPTLTGGTGGSAPATTQVATTILGGGEKTATGEALAMHYTGWKLSDGSQFDSSWDRGEPYSFVLGAGSVISGWESGILGQTVGSQVLLVIPPAEAYGEKGQSQSELAGETLVFVADILDAAKPAKA